MIGVLKQFPGARQLATYLNKDLPVLTDAQVGQYHGTGYIIFDPGLPMPLLDEAVRYVMSRPEASEKHHGTRVFNGWKDCPAIRTIALWPLIMRVLRQLYQREPKPFQTLNFPIGTEQKVHSDLIHFHSDPATYMCGVWLALEDIDMQNGPLVYYPESHKLPMVMMEDVAPGPGPQHYPLYEAHIEKVVQDLKLEPHYAALKKGQVLIWAANLLHGGSVHRDKGRTRQSQVTHYYFEGCQYYSPLSSYGGYRHFFRDEWVV
ncbi:MAG: phytanoyl-CoA dioxygenase family protein [Fimbriiglobus sp.]